MAFNNHWLPGMLGAPSQGWGTFQGVTDESFVEEQPGSPISIKPQISMYMNFPPQADPPSADNVVKVMGGTPFLASAGGRMPSLPQKSCRRPNLIKNTIAVFRCRLLPVRHDFRHSQVIDHAFYADFADQFIRAVDHEFRIRDRASYAAGQQLDN